MLPFKVDFDLLDWQSSRPGARAKVYRDGPKQLRLVEFTSEFVEPHWCEKGHVGLVLSGALEIDFRGQLDPVSRRFGYFHSTWPRRRA